MRIQNKARFQCKCKDALVHISPYYLADPDHDYGFTDELSVCEGTVQHYGYDEHFRIPEEGDKESTQPAKPKEEPEDTENNEENNSEE